MEEVLDHYNTSIIDRVRFGIRFLLILIGVMAAAILIGKLLKSPGLGVTIYIVGSILPFVFIDKLRAPFTRQVDVNFTGRVFTIHVLPLKEGSPENIVTINWDAISSYKIGILRGYKAPFLVLAMSLNDNSRLKYTFIDNPLFIHKELNPASVVASFHKHVGLYNQQQASELQKIVYKPAFLATPQGLIFTWGFAIVLTITVISLIITTPHPGKHSKPMASAIIVFYLLTMLLVLRRQSKLLYDKMKL